MKRGNIYFIVDDDPDDQELFLEALQGVDEFCTCETAFNGQDALQKLNTISILPDFIFLDLNMPRMNGKQFLAEIKKVNTLQDIPVIIYSTSTSKKDILDTVELGAAYFLEKPTRFNDLTQALSNIISRKWN